jgi:hypothetical protein
VPILKQHFPSEFDGDDVEDIINSGFFAHEVRDRDFYQFIAYFSLFEAR